MPGWKLQWYVNVPGSSKVYSKLSPWLRRPESKLPSSAVAVCGAQSSLVQVTVVPAATVSSGGVKAKSAIVTDVPSADSAPAPVSALGEASAAAAPGPPIQLGPSSPRPASEIGVPTERSMRNSAPCPSPASGPKAG